MNRVKRYRDHVYIFLILLCCYAYFMPRWADWNQNSRLNLVLAVVDDGTLHIDKYRENTGDYALFEGHYYSDKAPGTSFLAVPVYAVARPVLQSPPVQQILARLAQSEAFSATLKEHGSGLIVDKIYFAIVLYLVTITVVALPAAALGVLLYAFLGHVDQRRSWRIGVVLLYGLATPAFPYAGAFYGHQIVAVLLFVGFFTAFLIRRGRLPPRWTLLVGLLLGYAVITEYPAVLIAAALFLYTIAVLPNRRWALGLTLAGVPPGLLLMAYNWAIFRTILPVGYEHSELWTDVHQQGFMSLVGPNAPALWGITFGTYRGLFFIAPIMLLALPGFVAWWRRGQYRLEWAVCLWAVVSFFLFNGSSVMWQGGFAVGPRYLVPMLPFMAVALGMFVRQWGAAWWAKALVGILGAWSFVAVWAQTIGGQSFPDYTSSPLFSYSIPNLLAGNVARNLGMALGQAGGWSLLPLAVLVGALTLLWYLARGGMAIQTPSLRAGVVTDNRQKELQTDV